MSNLLIFVVLTSINSIESGLYKDAIQFPTPAPEIPQLNVMANGSEYVDAIDNYYSKGPTVGLARGAQDENYCYTKEKCGPKNWKGLCQTGRSLLNLPVISPGITQDPIKHQSPIDLSPQLNVIQKGRGQTVLDFKPLYSQPNKNFLLTNNGHTVIVQLTPDGTSHLEFCHTDLKSCYMFSQLHFHWADDLSKGSEHTLNNKSFPMEIHLVHYKKMFRSLTEAFNSHDITAAAVLALLVKVGAKNPQLQSITNLIGRYTLKPVPGKMLPVRGHLNLQSLLSKKRSFYRYNGSLSVPPCTEKILWTVFSEPIEMSMQQLAMFRKIYTPHELLFNINNFRPTLPLNGRQIQYFSN